MSGSVAPAAPGWVPLILWHAATLILAAAVGALCAWGAGLSVPVGMLCALAGAACGATVPAPRAPSIQP